MKIFPHRAGNTRPVAHRSPAPPLFNIPEVNHGDRFHLTDIDPDHAGLETFLIQQDNGSGLAAELVDSGTGKPIKKWYAGGVVDVGRGVVGDFSTTTKGCELFSTMGNTYDAKGNVLYSSHPFPPEAIWWDGDLLREFCATVGSTSESPAIEKFSTSNPATKDRLYTFYSEAGGCYWAYGGRPQFWGDLFGDWREEVVVAANDNSELRIYTTKLPAGNRLYTLMHNGQYRDQTTTKGYVQASYVDYYLGTGMEPSVPAPYSGAALVWRGDGANTWDTGLTANWRTNNLWISNTTTVVFNGESVLFDLTGSNHTAINLVGSLTPAEVTVYSPKNFIYGGDGSLDGTMKLTKAGTIVGSGALQKLGTATLALSANNSYSGGTFIQGGTVNLLGNNGNLHGLGNGLITFGGGTLSYMDLQASLTYGHNFNVPTNATGRINCDGRSYMTGSLTGSGTFTVMTPFIRTEFKGNWSAFTGQINIIPDSDGGDFRINNTYGYANASVNLASLVSVYHLTGSGVAIGALSGSLGSALNGTPWTVGAKNTDATFAGNIYGNSITKVGTGTWTLTGTNTYSGTTTVSAGTLRVNHPNLSGTGSGAVTVAAAGTLGGNGIIGGVATINGRLAPGNSVGTLTFSNSLTLTASSSTLMEISKSPLTNDLAKVTTTLTYGGTLIVTNVGGAFANGDSFKLFDAPVYAGSFNVFNLPPLTGGLVWDRSVLNTRGTLSIVLQTNVVPPAAPGSLIATAVSASQINLTWTDNATNENDFLVERSLDNTNFTQVISVGAGLTNAADTGLTASTLYYYRVRASNGGGNSACSAIASATTPAAPTGLVWHGDGAGNAWDVSVSSNWLANGAGVRFDDTGSNNVPVNLVGTVAPDSIVVNATKSYTFGSTGLIAGNGSLTKSGPGTLTFTNTSNNTFSGGVIINGGTVALGTDSGKNQKDFALGAGPVTIHSGGQLKFGGDSGGTPVQHYTTNAITLDGGILFGVDGDQHLNNSTVTVAAGGGTLLTRWKNKDILIESQLTGSGDLTVNYGTYVDGVAGDGGGFVYVSNPLNNYSGTITVRTNAIALTSPDALSNATLNAAGTGNSPNLVWSGITSIVLGGLSGPGNIALGANQLQVGNNDSSTEFSGTLSGTGSLIKNGGGTFTLIGLNSYSGLTTISNGTLQIGNHGTTGTLGTNNVINHATLAFNRADAISDSGVISGAGSLAQIGDGTLTLSQAHTYTGATTIESGTLALAGSGSIASSTNLNLLADARLDVSGRTGGSLTLTSGQTLSGNGVVIGNLTLGGGAKLSPGNSLGTLTFSNSLTLAAGSITKMEISTAPVANDTVKVLGNLTSGGTLVVTNISGATLAAGDSFPLFIAVARTGAFSGLTFPPLGTKLAWDTNSFLASGTLTVISTVPPAFNSVVPLGDGSFRLTFTGPAGRDYELRASTNLASLPRALWELLESATFSSNPVTYDDLSATNYPQRFYQIVVP